MSTADEQNQDVADDTSDLMQIPVAELVSTVWQRRRWLARVIGLGVLVSIGIALSIPSQYTSTAQLMPPDQQALSNISVLGALTGAGPVASLGGGLMSARTPGGTFIGILNSQTAQDDIINRLDLMRVYHCKLYIEARQILTGQITTVENKQSGIISISVTNPDPVLARDIAKAYAEELDKLINTMSTSSARRERLFLEERLQSIKTDLDANSRALSQFSSHNATLNPQSQGQTIIESVARLQSDLVTAQTELSGLKAQYADANVRVREARARVDELQTQLRKVGGTTGDAGGADLKPGQEYPTLRQLPILGVTYADLSRQLTIQESLYETLTRQYELAKVEEAKEIPPVKVLDQPEVAERKSSPHRSVIVLLGVLASAFAGIVWIVACKLWEITDESHPVKVFGTELVRIIRGRNAVAPN